jgi:hypothetical protein
MAFSTEKSSELQSFINVASVLGYSESQFFEVLLKTFNSCFSFEKFNTLDNFIQFRFDMMIKYVKKSSPEVSSKLSLAYCYNNTSQPTPTLTTSQVKNKKRRTNKKLYPKKPELIAPVPPPVVVAEPAPLSAKVIKRPKIEEPVIYKHPQHWVAAMPIVNGLNGFQKGMIVALDRNNVSKVGSVAHRSLRKDQYRLKTGLHLEKDGCQLCDLTERHHFFDDFDRCDDRRAAFVALHSWIKYGGDILDFNWWPQDWYLPPDDGWPLSTDQLDAHIKEYLAAKRDVAIPKFREVGVPAFGGVSAHTSLVAVGFPDIKYTFRLAY